VNQPTVPMYTFVISASCSQLYTTENQDAPVPPIHLENWANPQYFSMFHIIPNSTLRMNTFEMLVTLHSTDEDLALHL